jgi:hypothetical protein
MDNPWAFGWTQLFAGAGLILGVFGLRTLNKWRREKIEEKKVDLAMDAISLANESKGVFEEIRSSLLSTSEWDDMEVIPGEDRGERDRRGGYYARLKRIRHHAEFFKRAYAMQPRCAALFGVEAEDAFNKMHKARRWIEVACEMLAHDIKRPEDDRDLWFQLRADILGGSVTSLAKEPKRVDNLLEEFRAEVERLCRPSLEGQRSWVWPRWLRLRRKSPATVR